MGNINKLLNMAFHVVTFFLALTLLFELYHGIDLLVEPIAKSIENDNIMYEAIPTDRNHYTTQTELISLLMDELEYDIEVVDISGTYNIRSEGYSPADIGLYPLTGIEYEKYYKYKQNGELAGIIYRYVP